MKVFILFLIANVWIPLAGQELFVSFNQFSQAIETNRATTFTKLLSMSNNTNAFEAMKSDSSGAILLLKLNNEAYFSPITNIGEHYTFNSLNAIYFENATMSVLQLLLPHIKATLTLIIDEKGKKNTIEQEALSSGFLGMKLPEIQWPDEIPISNRFNGDILKIEKKLSTIEGFRYEITVVAVMDEILLESIRQLSTVFENKKDFIAMPGMILVFKNGNMQSIFNCCELGSRISFTYYIAF